MVLPACSQQPLRRSLRTYTADGSLSFLADDDGNSSERFCSKRTLEMSDAAKPNLAKIDLFQQCSHGFLEALPHHLHQTVFAAGAVIIKQGDIGTCMYLLNWGEVEVLELQGGEEFVVTTLRDGEIFGEMAVISRHRHAARRYATIRAKTTCACWVIDRSSLLQIFASFPNDAALISAHADLLLDDLVKKGFIIHPDQERQWLRLERRCRTWSKSLPGDDQPTLDRVVTGPSRTPSKSSSGTDRGGNREFEDVPNLARSITLPSRKASKGRHGTDRRRTREADDVPTPPATCGDSKSMTKDACNIGEIGTPGSLCRRDSPPDIEFRSSSKLVSAPSPQAIRQARRNTWKVGESAEVFAARINAQAFLNQRESRVSSKDSTTKDQSRSGSKELVKIPISDLLKSLSGSQGST